jgi:flagellar hook-associated protein 2
MANINSISGSSTNSTSSLYGNRNILSGLASGMDTESMIQNSISGYQAKLTSLRQDQEKIEWKQEAYRGLTDQMYEIAQKYTSYTSKTNLSSNGFFTSASTTTAQGANAAAVTASGRGKSEVEITSVSQLATASRYSVSASAQSFNSLYDLRGSKISVPASKKVSAIEGSITLTVGSTKYDVNFGASDVYDDAQALVEGINKKLEDVGAKAKATLNDGKITFASTEDKGDSVYISDASGAVKNQLGVQSASSSADPNRFSYNSINAGGKTLVIEKPIEEYLSDRTVSVTLDGVTKKVSIGTLTAPDLTSYDERISTLQSQIDAESDEDAKAQLQLQLEEANTERNDAHGAALAEQIKTNLQENINRAFGANKISVTTDHGALRFDAREGSGSSLSAKSDIEELGLKHEVTNYFDSGRKLDSLLGSDFFRSEGGDSYEDKMVVVNGVKIGKFGKDSSLDEVMNAINSSSEAGVNVSFSRLTGEFVFNATSTGAGQQIEFGEGLASRLFGGGNFTEGKDAILAARVNGTELTLQRASNTLDMDGMNVTLKSTFTEGEAITFKTAADSDKIVDTIKSFVEDINKLMKDVHDAYATMPAEKSSKSHTKYEPLTEDDKKDMSEAAIKAYEEKAKQGIVFGDSDLSTLYDKLRGTIEPTGQMRMDLKKIGITTAYSNGVTTLSIDEDKLRAALDSDPDSVKNVFATTLDKNGNEDGMMKRLKKTLDAYASTSFANPGILVRKAGSKFSATSLLNNNLQKQIDNLNTQIENWETKISSKIDYYTKQFTALEKMISTMNNQSSMLADLYG